ncbi:MAG: Rieske 2Fe-2S domain-containing protein [Candidatus Dormibacteria bacterium]
MPVQGQVGKQLTDAVSGLEQSQVLDGPADAISRAVSKVTGADAVKNLLSGAWLGHALHPVLTDLPIGFWSSAVALDFFAGEDAEDGAELLMGLGNLGAVAAAASGLADWSDSYGPEKRVGMLHGVANTAGLVLMTGSWLARRSGEKGLGRALGLVGLGVASASAYLGGHLVFSRGMGVQHAGFDLDQAVEDWADVAAEADLVEGKPLLATAGEVPVLLFREAGQLLALANRCSHAAGPLNEGDFRDGAVTCPWHGSRFALEDGCVLRGPASLPQPRFEARVREGRVQVRSA